MGRAISLCAVCTLVASAVAWGSTPAKPTPAPRSGPDGVATTSTGVVLFGDTSVEARRDYTRAGRAEAFQLRSRRSGVLTSISVYLDSRNAASIVMVGLYTDPSDHPSRQVASGLLSSPKAARWNTVIVRSTRIFSGRTYWVALLGREGRLYFRVRSRARCLGESSAQTDLKSLPSSWNPGRRQSMCSISAYGKGHPEGASPKPVGSSPTSPGANGPPAGSVPCPLAAAAESCWALHTGVPGYSEAQILAGHSALKHVVGNITVRADGAVISDKWIDGCIAIDAKNVTIENSLIVTQNTCQGGDYGTAPSAINDGDGATTTGLVIKDTEVDGMSAAGNSYGVSGGSYTCLRCNVHGFTKNLTAGNDVLIQDTYSHDLSIHDDCAHAETIYADSATNITVEHAYLRASGSSDGCITAAFMNGGTWGPPSNITLDKSYLEGFSGADMEEACGSTDIRVTNNAFSDHNGYNSTDYVYGFDRYDAGNAWSGNYVPEHDDAVLGNPGRGGC